MPMNVVLVQPDFARRLQAARDRANLTKAELAERAGLSFRTIHELEKGSRDRVQEKTLRLLAEALGVEYEELRTGQPATEPGGAVAEHEPRTLPRRGFWWLAAGAVLAVIAIVILGSQPRLGGRLDTADPPRLAVRFLTSQTGDEPDAWAAGLQEFLAVGFRTANAGLVVDPTYLASQATVRHGARPADLDDADWLDVMDATRSDYGLTARIALDDSGGRVDWVLVDRRGVEWAASETVTGPRLRGVGCALFAGVFTHVAAREPAPCAEDPQGLTLDDDAFDAYVAGIRARGRDEFGRARELFASAVQQDPTFTLARLRLVDAQVLGTDFAGAAEAADAAWEDRQRLSLRDRLWLEALRHAVAEERDAAMASHEELVLRWPEDKELLDRYVHGILYGTFHGRGDEITARALETFPDDPVLLEARAYVLSARGSCDEAYAISARLVELRPEHADSWTLHALNAYRAGETDLAVEHARVALSLDPEGVWPQIRMSVCQYRQGNVDKAVEWYSHVAARDDLTDGLRLGMLGNIVNAYCGAGRFREATAVLPRMAALAPESDRERIRLGNLMFIALASADTAATRAYLDRLASLAGADSAGSERSRTATLDARSGDVAAAGCVLAELESELPPDQDVPEGIRRLRAEVAVADGRPQEALAELEAMPGFLSPCGRSGMHHGAQQLAARVYVGLGRLDDAIASQVVFVERNRAIGEGFLELGRLYEAGGYPDEAAAAYRDALSVWRKADPGFVLAEQARARLEALLAAGAAAAETAMEH